MISALIETSVVNSKRNHFEKPIFVEVGDIESNSEILGYRNHVYYVEMARF